jgi:hypothetical protein
VGPRRRKNRISTRRSVGNKKLTAGG